MCASYDLARRANSSTRVTFLLAADRPMAHGWDLTLGGQPVGYFCVCDPGWTGPDCAVDVDECSSDPCRNSGVCIDQLNGYYCQCLSGFTGKLIDPPALQSALQSALRLSAWCPASSFDPFYCWHSANAKYSDVRRRSGA
jgi:hypothetical protein